MPKVSQPLKAWGGGWRGARGKKQKKEERKKAQEATGRLYERVMILDQNPIDAVIGIGPSKGKKDNKIKCHGCGKAGQMKKKIVK